MQMNQNSFDFSYKVLRTNDHLEFLTAILTADTEEGLLQTATIILQSYYSCFAIWLTPRCSRDP